MGLGQAFWGGREKVKKQEEKEEEDQNWPHQ